MLGNIESPILEAISASAFAFVLLILGIQKIVRDWKTTRAESDIITMLHTEIQRMEEQNTRLSTEVHNLQQKIIQLGQEVTKLTVENSMLNEKISALIKELDMSKVEVNNGPSKN